MATGFVHTVFKDANWINKVEGKDDPLPGTFATKEEAVPAGRNHAISTKTEHVIHNMDGSIGERNSYGNDPASRPG